ncbi:MAG TPA: hypothetical protein IAC79_01525, partial [Candidatus Spyradenecus faecavium]|nr:hypothetical protein [Candidatus Spyradenecus faecavium]
VYKRQAQGLWAGRPRGNFRFKARLEGSHSLVHNELGAVRGQVGYTRDNAPESLYAMDKAEGALLRACATLAQADPGLPERLRWPYIPYADYAALVAEAVARINDRTEHALEGWEEQGFVTGSFRLGPREPWRDLADLDALPEGMRGAILAQLRADRAFMPVILGEGLALRGTVSDRLEIKVKDPAIDYAATVAAIVRGPDGVERLLARGQAVLVWVNPLEPLVAYLAEPTKDGPRYLGTAPVMAPAHQDDAAAIAESLKIRAKVQALERAAILPAAQAAAERKRADDAWNREQLAAAREAAKAPGMRPGRGQALEGLAAPAPEGPAQDLDALAPGAPAPAPALTLKDFL